MGRLHSPPKGSILLRNRLFVIVVALLGAASAVPSAAADPSLFFGFSEDAPKWYGSAAGDAARGIGAKAFRITLQWRTGERALDADDRAELAQAVAGTVGMRLVVSVYAAPGIGPPLDDEARDDYCSYVRDVVASFPGVNDVSIWNEPNLTLFWRPQFNPDRTSAAPAAYQALLARCYDVLHAYRPAINVIGFATAPGGNDDPSAASNTHSPGNFIRRAGEAYRASGRTRPLFDTFGHHVHAPTAVERPWRQHIGALRIGQGDWNKLMRNLALAFSGTAQPIPGECAAGRCVSIWYLEAGVQTAIDPEKASLYQGTENVGVVPDYAGGEPEWPPPSAESPAPDQWTQIIDGVRLAYCQPYVGAYFNFLLWDEPYLGGIGGWQSAPFWVDRTPKDSLPAFRQVIAEVEADAVDCSRLKGGPPSSDFTPPSTPANVSAVLNPDPARVELT